MSLVMCRSTHLFTLKCDHYFRGTSSLWPNPSSTWPHWACSQRWVALISASSNRNNQELLATKFKNFARQNTFPSWCIVIGTCLLIQISCVFYTCTLWVPILSTVFKLLSVWAWMYSCYSMLKFSLVNQGVKKNHS